MVTSTMSPTGFLSRDPIGFKGSPYDLYEFLDSIPLNRVDPNGTECSTLIIMGHNFAGFETDVNTVIDELEGKLGQCDRVGVISCSCDTAMNHCKDKLGEEHTIDGWPEVGQLYCKDVVRLLKEAWPAIKASQDAACKDCKCKESKIMFNCQQSMSQCLDKHVKAGTLKFNPCGTTITKPCK